MTRDSVIHLAKGWKLKVSERKISMDEIFETSKKGVLKEVFGTGTAAVISPVGEIHHEGQRIVVNDNRIGHLAQRLYDEITGMQYGEKPDLFGWIYRI